MIQDTMRIYCIDTFNKVYQTDKTLKAKLKGRNYDIQTKNMEKQYTYLKEKADENRKRLDKVNKQTDLTLSQSKQIKEIISELKPTKITKNNFVISNEQIDAINNYIDNVDANVSDIKNVSDLTSLMEDFEEDLKNHDLKVGELQAKVNEQSKRIGTLELQNIKKQNKIVEQRKEIGTLEKEISRLEKIIEVWQNFWQKILEFFQDKFFSSKNEDKIYEQVIDEMLEKEILDNEDIDYIQDNYYSKDSNNLER